VNITTSNKSAQQNSILLAEDDEVTAYMLEYLLQREGYAVHTVYDGRDALDAINAASYSIAMIDLMIPYVNGFQLISHIRSLPQWRDSAIIIVSGKSQEKDIVKALDSGANDYIVKPFQPSELLARVRRLVRKTCAA
jgi:DNA-binding response OmpR family regulator